MCALWLPAGADARYGWRRMPHPRYTATGICIGALLAGSLCLGLGAQDRHAAIVSTSDIRIGLSATDSAPHLLFIDRKAVLSLRNQGVESLPSSVEANGATISVAWRHKPAEDTSDPRHVVFVYESENPHLRLRWEWLARADFGPVEHRIVIENLSYQDFWLPMVDSLRVAWDVAGSNPLRNFYVEKGAGAPSAQGTHLDSMPEGYRWTGTSSPYAFPPEGAPREIIPAAMVYSPIRSRAGWFAGIEFSGRTRISVERGGDRVESVLGLDPDPGPFRTRLAAGGSFETPTVFLGAFEGGPDGAGNELRPWVRAVLGNPITWKDEHYPLVVNNSWGSGMAVDEPLALRMIDESKELGVEMFHLDAGWFRGVGDWYPDAKKFPHGLAYVADKAHEAGMRFGMWVDWTQAGIDTEPGALNVHDPKVRGWLAADVAPGWKPEEFKGQTVDVGVPAARDYFGREVKRIVDSYHLDMLEHDGYLVVKGCMRDDHPHAPPDHATMSVKHDWGWDFVLASNATDVSYHAVRAYYDIYEQTRREHPGLLFEICNDGGRMVDFGSAAHGDYFSITDIYDPLSNRRAFYDTSYVLPAAMLESYVEKWPAPRREQFLYMLRSGMMGWFTLMLDTSAWTREEHEAARDAISLYKRELRPLIRDARLYHVSARPDGEHWDGVEYWDPARGKGVVFAFRGSIPDEADHRFVLAGLDPAKSYRVHFQDGSAPDRQTGGSELMGSGLLVRLPVALSSELVFLSEEAAR
jgi:alpha-galactosidase